MKNPLINPVRVISFVDSYVITFARSLHVLYFHRICDFDIDSIKVLLEIPKYFILSLNLAWQLCICKVIVILRVGI